LHQFDGRKTETIQDTNETTPYIFDKIADDSDAFPAHANPVTEAPDTIETSPQPTPRIVYLYLVSWNSYNSFECR